MIHYPTQNPSLQLKSEVKTTPVLKLSKKNSKVKYGHLLRLLVGMEVHESSMNGSRRVQRGYYCYSPRKCQMYHRL